LRHHDKLLLGSGGDVLGEVGSAYRKMAVPFRDLEDALLMGPVIGGMKAQMQFLASAFMDAAVPVTDGVKTELGALDFLTRTMTVCAYQAARMIDNGMNTEAYQPLLLSLRYLAGDFQSRVERLAGVAGLSGQGNSRTLTTTSVRSSASPATSHSSNRKNSEKNSSPGRMKHETEKDE